MPTAARDIELRLAHGRVAARVWGDPSAPPVLALHGWLDNAASFDRLAPLLSRERYLVCLDLPGHGRSGWRSADAWYHFVDAPSDLLQVVDALGWERFSLLGHSLGGAIASVFAALFPQRVRELVLIEALGPITTNPDRALEQWRRACADRVAVASKRLRVFADLDEAVEARMQANTLSRRAAALLVERALKRVDGGYSWSSDPRLRLASPLRLSEEQVLAVLAGIRAPTLLILAQPPAPYLSPEMMQRRIDCVGEIRVHTLPGTHHLHLEEPRPVAAVISEFLRARADAPVPP